MASWTPEHNQRAEALIEAAREGDIGHAAGLLQWIAHCLENGWPLPEPLRLYLVDALRQIAGPHGGRSFTIRSIKDLRKSGAVKLGDANAALNLKRRRGRKRAVIEVGHEVGMLAYYVQFEMWQGNSWEEARDAVADQMGVSERTISRAWEKGKDLLPPMPPPLDNK